MFFVILDRNSMSGTLHATIMRTLKIWKPTRNNSKTIQNATFFPALISFDFSIFRYYYRCSIAHLHSLSHQSFSAMNQLPAFIMLISSRPNSSATQKRSSLGQIDRGEELESIKSLSVLDLALTDDRMDIRNLSFH